MYKFTNNIDILRLHEFLSWLPESERLIIPRQYTVKAAFSRLPAELTTYSRQALFD